MKMHGSLFLFLIFLGQSLTGQGWSKHFNFSDPDVPDSGHNVLISNDTLYQISSKDNNDGLIDVISMLDTEGNIIKQREIDWANPWLGQKTFLKDGNKLIYVQHDDETLFDEKMENGIELMVLNLELDSLAYHYYPTKWLNHFLYVQDVLSTADHYVVSSSVNIEDFEHYTTFLWINKDDFSLEKTYVYEDQDSRVDKFEVIDDKIHFGYVRSRPGSLGSRTNYVAVLDENGELDWVWGQEIGARARTHTWVILSDGSTIVQSDHISGYPEWLKLDSEGNEVWRNRRLSENFAIEGRFNSATTIDMMETSDGNFLAYGQIFDDLNYDGEIDITGEVITYTAGHIMKVDATDGSIIWERTLLDLNEVGAPMGFLIRDMVEGSDGSFYGTGMSFPNVRWFDDDPTEGLNYEIITDRDTWLFKLTADGCFIPESCSELRVYSTSASDNSPDHPEIIVSPNPTFDRVNIALPLSMQLEEILLVDQQGKILKSFNDNYGNTTIDLSAYSQGLYFLHFLTASEREVKKILKI